MSQKEQEIKVIKGNVENITKIELAPLPKSMRWGKVNYRIIIREKDQINDAIKLIKRCYNLQLKWRK